MAPLSSDAGVASALERSLRRDRFLIAAALAALTLLSWMHMVLPDGAPAGTERLLPCCGARFSVTFSMWVVMMAGMMIPSVAPMVLTHASIVRRQVARGAPFVPSGLFLTGYLVAWTAFAAVAAIAQWALFRAALLDGASLAIGPWAGCGVLIAAAVFQLSPVKDRCLSQCRAPLGYFVTEWREGHVGAVVMGVRHGVFCVGCCWMLMAVLFAVGIMNIVWGAAITAFVLAEKVLPWPRGVVWTGSAGCLLGAVVLAYRAAHGV
jgi:predicted metal-binding membrane protein